MKTIWIVDDEKDILEVLRDIFEVSYFTNFKLVESHVECKPVKGDIVAHDLIGVGNLEVVVGVTYFSHSGSCVVNADFIKPSSTFIMVEKLIEVYNGKWTKENHTV